MIDLRRAVKPTRWRRLKTDAVDFSREFRWYDDCPSAADREVLRCRERPESWIRVDLERNTDCLCEFAR